VDRASIGQFLFSCSSVGGICVVTQEHAWWIMILGMLAIVLLGGVIIPKLSKS